MTIYILLIFLTVLIATTAENQKAVSVAKDGTASLTWPAFYTVLLLAVWCGVYTFRAETVGTDTPGYYRTYTRIVSEGLSLRMLVEERRDWLFSVLQFCCAKISRGNWFFFQFVVSLMIYCPLTNAIKKHSPWVVSSLLITIFTFTYFSGFNGMRQAIAGSLVFYAYYELLLSKQYVKYGILIFLAMCFHSSVVFAIPVHILSLFDIRTKITQIITAAAIAVYAFIWKLWPLVIRFLLMIGQTKMAEDYAELPQDKGSGLLRFIVAILPFVIASLYRKYLEEDYENVNNELVLSLFGSLFALLSMRYWIFSRVAAYFQISQIMLIPKLCSAFAPKSRKLAKICILAMYFLYMVAILLHGDGHYYPYSFWKM